MEKFKYQSSGKEGEAIDTLGKINLAYERDIYYEGTVYIIGSVILSQYSNSM